MKALLLAVVALAATTTFAQPIRAGGEMATRSVSRYLVLERDLQQAVVSRDANAVQSHVAEDFTYRGAANADVLDRDTWLAHEPRRVSVVRELTVRDEDSVSIVSFVAGRRFIVDVWKGDQLVARSASVAADAPREPKRPSGRE